MLKDVIEILSDMIRIDSRNTKPLQAPGERIATEEEMGNCVEKLMAAMGMSVERQYIAPKRPNVIGFHSCGVAGAPCIGLNAHLDTVGTDGMVIPPFEPTIKDGLIYGRGSCDTKASLAAMLKACESIINSKLPIDVLMVATASEETACQGAPFLQLDKWPCNGFIVGEPTSNKPIVFHKCHAVFDLVCRGKAAHGSRPELGDNAIFKTTKLLIWLQEKAIPEVTAITSPNFERGCTLSPNMVSGGIKNNIVPDCCRLTFDLRLVPEIKDPMAVMKKIADDATRDLGFKVELADAEFSPGMMTPADHPFVQAVRDAVASKGLDSTPLSVAFCTDAGVLSRKGFPCVVLGPGDISVAHSALEYAPIEQIRQAVGIYVAAAEMLLK